MSSLGRNDPCHCGSGKKYKKCHLDADQHSRAVTRRSQADAESPPAFFDVNKLPDMLRWVSRKGPAKDRKEFGDLISRTEPILEYMARRAEIEAASTALEAHRTEFEKLAADQDRCVELAEFLFAEECFAPLRFSASDVENAFAHVGYPAMMSPDDRMVEVFREAILRVADRERRGTLSMRLLLHFPEFVATGRYMEGWLVQSASLATAEDEDESNAFLFQMFSFGYDAWAAEKQAKDESLLRELGIDLDALRSMKIDELDSWLQSQTSDPAKAAAMEEFYRKNPSLREESIANIEALERNAGRLLEREDSRFLLLPVEEVETWLARLNERGSVPGFLPGPPSEESVRQYFDEVALPFLREMAGSIFTPERIRQLVAELRKYRSELFAAGDKQAAGHVTAAINYVEGEDSPGLNTFLLSLCWTSVDSAIKALSGETAQPAEF